jgi:hypothetical protein
MRHLTFPLSHFLTFGIAGEQVRKWAGGKVRKARLVASMGLLFGMPLFGQTNSEPAGELPKLLPPYGELPPTFWEQHGTRVTIAGLAALALARFAVWLWLRPKPAVILPPEVQARQALEPLRERTEDGVLLSEVSQILRRYVIAAFELPCGELTTSEFCRALSSHDKLGEELSAALGDFLRECDERKFSTRSSSAPMEAADQALKLIAQAEGRRAQLRQLAAAAVPPHAQTLTQK